MTAITQEPREPELEVLLNLLSTEEQIALLAGSDFWHTVAIERLGIPRLRVTDGPAGARGTRFDGPASVNVPCSTALAATWNPALVEEVGHLLGREARAKGARTLLAPTVNLHRTPIGGRNFECMSEDPYLTARVAVAYVSGVQAEGVASCIKHFVGNDTEFERMSIDSRIDERTLRELYLVPFEAAVREAGVMAVMTSYNRINGPFAADNAALISDVLRGEWGFDGLVMSDWFGLHSTVEGVVAGVDLEMPGPTMHRGVKLADALGRGEVTTEHIRQRARAVLVLLDRLGVLRDGEPSAEITVDSGADRDLVRRAGASGMVLLRNEPTDASRRVLPLDVHALRKVAVIGPNAEVGQVMGGGSAHVTPTHTRHPLDALHQRLGSLGVEVVHGAGCSIHRRLPELNLGLCGPVEIEYFTGPSELDRVGAVPALVATTGTARLMWLTDPLERGASEAPFGARLTTMLTADVSGPWRFGIESVAASRVLVDGIVLLDNSELPTGGSFFGMGKAELTAEVVLEAGRTYLLQAEVRCEVTGMSPGGINLGALAPTFGDAMIDALDLAASADVSIVVVGTNDDWESEGWDRETLDLPGRQNELIASVAAVSERTVVVVNAGSPVAMPWLGDVDAVLMAWFPGQEFGDSLVDVLLGELEPQGRLPVTFPARLSDTPAYEHHPGRTGVSHYLEGRLMGYRWYDTTGRKPLFGFGFGLGYAELSITASRLVDPWNVEVDVANASDRAGVEVVQVYIHRSRSADESPGGSGDEPEQRLAGFARVAVPPGGSVTTRIALDPRAYQSWSVDSHRWEQFGDVFEVRVGRSSRHIGARFDVRP
jgi:beta-glucosidase